MSSACTCVYTANAFGSTSTGLAASMNSGAVPVDPSILEITGVTVTSDVTTTPTSSKAVRTIVLNLTSATFKGRFPDATDQRSPFWNFMTGLLQASAISPVLAAAPVLS